MKKFDLLKVLGITLLVITLISWVIPAGGYSNGTFSSLGSTVTIGLYDLFRLPVITIVTFIQYGLLFLTIGGFYGVLNKTAVYSKLIEKIVNKVEKNKSRFLVLTVILFAVLTSLIGTPALIFVIVPLFVAVLLKLGYSKLTTFASTVGSILIGQIGTTFGFTIWGFLKYRFGVEMTELLFARIILLAVIIALFVLLIRKNSSKEVTKPKKTKKSEEVKEEKINIPLYKDSSSKKSLTPLVIISLVTFVVLVLGLYNWYYAFEIDFFSNLYDSIINFKIGNYPIFNNLLGGVSQLGFFSNYDLIVVLIISSLLIGWIYSLKLGDIVDGFKNGCKEMLKPALYSMLASVVFTALLNVSNSYGGDFVYTIINKFVSGSEQFSLSATIGSGLVAGFAYNDFYTMITNLYGIFGVYDSNIIPIIAFIFQTMYSVVMVIAPTSIFLLAGLSYLEIPYKEWVKYIWKFLLIVFGIVVVIAFILTTLV